MAYTDVATLKTYLAISGSGDDVLLGTLIDRAQAIIDQETQTTFEATSDTTRYFDAVADVRGRTLRFDSYIASFTSVVNGDGATVTSGQYVKTPRNSAPYYAITLLVSSGVAWRWATDPENAIAVTGKWAYSTTAPADIQHAAIRLAAYLYRQKDNAADLDRTMIAGNTTILPAALPSDMLRMLVSYRPRL